MDMPGNQCVPERAVPCDPVGTRGTAPYEVQLMEVENGFLVKVGCKHFVALSWEEVASKLGEYFKDPDGARKKYCRS